MNANRPESSLVAEISPHRPVRRRLLGAGAAAAGASVLGFPAIVRAAEPVRLGMLLPFSGGLELFGQQGEQGITLAVEEVNAAGGVLGRKVEIIKADDKTDPKTRDN